MMMIVAVDHHHGGVNNGGKEGVSVVQVGRSLDQRMKLDGELQVEIELSRVEEDRLEERLWMDKDGHQYVRLDEEEDVRHNPIHSAKINPQILFKRHFICSIIDTDEDGTPPPPPAACNNRECSNQPHPFPP